ncbi:MULTISPECIES: DUF6259 domain-containing protein [unclassified Oceanispirochaeta]|uniref:DUF6259 domain-containing protein n=1 Tax=unclassified Oceanispirochaeta TaxID=2635722 RepID=UPI000E09B916|nr:MULTISPECIES: DUF6259 domain-containing protein [unclassified Oceanispirochaeta]MBF9016930.1 hypothetical protein [Oceanispirochaeta sp. M2]NPD73293.1 hypothetical protein [Oceanispirochaeta sp. M1]RDG30957.1 hypothetical protein DV872_14430 [Oceanispirochaeta sp. M1]
MRIFDSSSFTVDSIEINNTCQELTVRGRAYCVWPNREGEGFMLESVSSVLADNGCNERGLSLSWPATASARAIILKSEDASVLIRKINESNGYHEEIRIFADSSDILRFRFTGPIGEFVVTELSGSYWTDAAGNKGKSDLNSIPKQFQLGLISPEGECAIPAEEGFRALIPLGREIINSFPITKTAHILHLFGYGAGHDRAYPDYSPSEMLGGSELFKSVLSRLKDMGFRISLYMNARLLDASRRDTYPRLKESILKDPEGKEFTEEYFGRTFLVMDPSSAAWQDELYSQALMLHELGADLLQLDQVAGRAAPVTPGSPWGEGYADLIHRIQKLGMKVWIQGVSDYYPADCFEMTWKDLEILEGGILRGGNPFGVTDLSLLKALKDSGNFKGTLLTPMDKRDTIDPSLFSFRLDLMDKSGLLPLYGPDYMKRIVKFASLF